MKKGLYDQGISEFSKALDISPNDALAYGNRAVAYYIKREFEKAWRDVEKAQSLGYQFHPEFLKDLRKASGREK
jgi:Flp pilus assembly protein TadD